MDQPPRRPSEAELQHIINFTIVTLVGMLGGIIIGYVAGHGARPAAQEPPSRVKSVAGQTDQSFQPPLPIHSKPANSQARP